MADSNKGEFSFWKFFIGKPLATHQLVHEKLQKIKALPVFASDALSSVAYATEEMLLVLILAGSFAVDWILLLGFCIMLLLFVVAISYRQTIMAYPNGGGAYIVSRDNLGVFPSKVAGAALLIDYVLTVAVSIAAGVAAITSALPILLPYKVLICILMITGMTLANLRGMQESAKIFMYPTYFFIFSIFLLIVSGVGQYLLNPNMYIPPHPVREVVQPLSALLLLKAFASGCTALTGIEAIADGVAAFREPTSKNASTTLLWMAAILGASFIGITFLTKIFHIVPSHSETVVSQISRMVFGNGFIYYFIQASTALILLLAANTSYQDFPRLASFIAKDGFLPRQLAQLGDRLVFSNGIIILGVLYSLLVWMFQATVHFLVPLYAVGVFLSFTLSQSGMIVRWWKQRRFNLIWFSHISVNVIGVVVCFAVLLVLTYAKFIHGAWIVFLLIPLGVYGFYRIRGHYNAVKVQLSLDHYRPRPLPQGVTYVLVADEIKKRLG